MTNNRVFWVDATVGLVAKRLSEERRARARAAIAKRFETLDAVRDTLGAAPIEYREGYLAANDRQRAGALRALALFGGGDRPDVQPFPYETAVCDLFVEIGHEERLAWEEVFDRLVEEFGEPLARPISVVREMLRAAVVDEALFELELDLPEDLQGEDESCE